MKRIISILLMLIILINVITDAFTVKVYAETESNSVTNAENYKPYDPNIAYNQNLIIKSNNMMMRSTGLSPNDVLAVGTTACAFLPQAALITGGVTLAIYLGYKLYQEVSAEGYIREDGSIRTTKAYFDSIRLKLENLCGTRDTITIEGNQLFPTVTTNVWTYYYNGAKTMNLINYTPYYAGPYRNVRVETSTDLPYEIQSQKHNLVNYTFYNISPYTHFDISTPSSAVNQTYFGFKTYSAGSTMFSQTFVGAIQKTIFNLYTKVTWCDNNFKPLNDEYVSLDSNSYNVVIPIVDDLIDTPIIPGTEENTELNPYDVIINPMTLPEDEAIVNIPFKEIIDYEPASEVGEPDKPTDTDKPTNPDTPTDPDTPTETEKPTKPEVSQPSPLAGLIEILEYVFSPLFDWLDDFFDGIKTIFKPLFNWLDNFFQRLQEVLKPIFDWITDFFIKLSTTIENALKPINDWLGDFFSSIKSTLEIIFKPLFDWLADFFTQIKNILEIIFKPLFDFILDCPAMLENLLKQIFEPVIDLALELWTKFKTAMSDLFIPTIDLKTAFELPEDKTINPIKLVDFSELLFITPKPIRFETTVHFGSVTHDVKIYFDEVDVIMDNIDLIRNIFSYTLLLLAILSFVAVMLPKRTMD